MTDDSRFDALIAELQQDRRWVKRLSRILLRDRLASVGNKAAALMAPLANNFSPM